CSCSMSVLESLMSGSDGTEFRGLAYEVLEAHLLAQVGQRAPAGLALSVFHDEYLGISPVVRVWIVLLLAVQAQQDVAVLLDGAAVAEVRQDGALVRAPLDVPAKLAQGQHGDVQRL